MRFLKASVAALAVVAALGAAAVVRADGDEKKAGAKSERAFLGVNVAAESAKGGKGVVVGEVVKGSAAEKAGLKKGDVILKLGESEVASAKGLVELLGKHKPGDEVVLLVLREGAQAAMKATLGKRPADDDGDDDDDDDDDHGGPRHDEGHEHGEKR